MSFHTVSHKFQKQIYFLKICYAINMEFYDFQSHGEILNLHNYYIIPSHKVIFLIYVKQHGMRHTFSTEDKVCLEK